MNETVTKAEGMFRGCARVSRKLGRDVDADEFNLAADVIAHLGSACAAILKAEELAWKPMRVFRTEQEKSADDDRREVWEEAATMVRNALADADRALAAHEAKAE
jgi:hypothetical protein